MKTLRITLALILALFSTMACDDGGGDDKLIEICNNAADDDGDGLFDCDDPDCSGWSGCQTNNINNINNVNNSNNVNNVNNTTGCPGDVPLADLQDGVCTGTKKVCNETTIQWEEPDYSQVSNYEATEISCDGLDNNCDGQTDEELTVTVYPDTDNDNQGDGDNPTQACSLESGFVINTDDCDDTDDEKYLGNTEICDGKDNDCNGQVDEGVMNTYFRDFDNDSYGDPNVTAEACSPPSGYVANSTDCNDGDTNYYIAIDYFADTDNDGQGDSASTVFACGPAPSGYVGNSSDCDDSDQDKFLGNTEKCDGKDNDCNEQIDELWLTLGNVCGSNVGRCQQGVVTCTADKTGVMCDGEVSPIAETCNGIDDDCNGVDDNSPVDAGGACSTGNSGVCAFGIIICSSGATSCQQDTSSSAETCGNMGYDDDCNGVDDDISNLGNSCSTGLEGVCATGQYGCNSTSFDCIPDVQPNTQSETCNGNDDDCDGIVDNNPTDGTDYYKDFDNDGYGDILVKLAACSKPAGFVLDDSDCDDSLQFHWSDCGNCIDIDLDNFGVGCDLGTDCDDDSVTGTTCQTGCTTYYADTDTDGYGDTAALRDACVQPSGHVVDNSDCAPSDVSHWHDCGNCVDVDGDNYGTNCDFGTDCDDTASTGSSCNTGCNTYYQDTDNDGHGVGSETVVACTEPTGYVSSSDDCDDDVTTGSSCFNTCASFYIDSDGDSHGDPSVDVTKCVAPAGYVSSSDDCDDGEPDNYPGNTEICDTIDNDCNGDIDDGLPTTTYYRDSDDDGFGDGGDTIDNCASSLDGYVIDNTDCDDTNTNRYPGALEICNGIDMDCDSVIDAGTCQGNASCSDDGAKVDAYCLCDTNYIELPSDLGVCHEAVQPSVDALAITELMIEAVNSNSVAEGQYFEVYNTTDATLDLSDVGFFVDNSTEDATSEVSTPTLLAPHDYFVIALTDDTDLNGGVDVDHVFVGMPELITTDGYIELYRVSNSDTFDIILWDTAWNHSIGTSLNLSPGALDGDPVALNDDGVHWCHTRFGFLAEGDKGTPGSANDDCLVNWCNVQWPISATVNLGETTELIYGQVYELGITEAGGQGGFISSELGFGPENSTPDASWLWTAAIYNQDTGNNDEYVSEITPTVEGIYDYAYRTSLDGGLSWLHCDINGSEGDGSTSYDTGASGIMVVDPMPPGTMLWAKRGGGTAGEHGTSITVDSSGNTYITGSFTETATFETTSLTSDGTSDIFIVKYDSSGNVLWAKRGGGAGSEVSYGIAVDNSGNAYITGYFDETVTFGTKSLTSVGANDAFVVKYDSSGNVLWAKRGGGAGYEGSYGIAVDSNSHAYITGMFQGTATFGSTSLTSAGGNDTFVVKYDSSGNVLWAKRGGGISGDDSDGIAVDSSGNSYITGIFNETTTFGTTSLTSAGSNDAFVVKYDPSGNVLWAKKGGGVSGDFSYGIAVDSSGNSYITGIFNETATFGTTSLTSAGSNDVFVVKYDPSGNVLWAKKGGGTSGDFSYSIAVDSNSHAYITGMFQGTATFGSTSLTSAGASDVFVVKYDSSGNVLWANHEGGTNWDHGYGIAVDNSNYSYIIGDFKWIAAFGTTSLTSVGDSDVFVVKYSP
jgi:Putative metal-binding motif/Beta-propeller repeat